MMGSNRHEYMSPADFLASFRAGNNPAINTHPLRSRLTISICLVVVLALTLMSTLAIAANRENYERIAWLATLRGRAAILAKQRAVISGGWKFDMAAVHPCSSFTQWAANSAQWTRGPSTQVSPSRSRAATRTCRETQTAKDSRIWLASEQQRLKASVDARTIKHPFTLATTGKGEKRVLRGLIVTPASARLAHLYDNAQGKRPLIVCASGLGVTMGYCRWLIADLAAPVGWTTLVFDPSGIAANATSTGPMENMSVMTEERDLESMVRYARTLPWVDGSRIVLAGQSQGGLASLICADCHPSWVWRLAIDYPALNIPAYVHYMFPTKALIPPHVGVMGFQMGHRYATDVWDLRPWTIAARVRVPTLIEQGEEDFAVDPSVSYRLAGTMPSARLVLVPNERHNFHNAGRVTSVARLIAFLQGSLE